MYHQKLQSIQAVCPIFCVPKQNIPTYSISEIEIIAISSKGHYHYQNKAQANVYITSHCDRFIFFFLLDKQPFEPYTFLKSQDTAVGQEKLD